MKEKNKISRKKSTFIYAAPPRSKTCGFSAAPTHILSIALFFSFFSLLSSCTTQQIAMRADPELVGSLLPGIIKSNESKLKKHPDNQQLILETGSYYVMYANAFVQGPAKMLPPSRYEERAAQYKKAKELYLHGVEILQTGLEQKHPGIINGINQPNQNEYLAKFTKDDVPFIYWLTAAALSAYSIDPFDLSLGMRIPSLRAMIKKAYELDPDWSNGALDEFFMIYYASLPPELGGDKSLVAGFYERALEKSNGVSSGPYVSWAELVSIPEQNYDDFKEKLALALAVNINKNPDIRLINILAQRKAKYYLKEARYYFVEAE